MEVPYKSFVSSFPFTIKGPNGRTFFIHSDLMAKHSKVLEKTAGAGMKESQDHVVNIVDIDEDLDDGTVMRFIEYAYTGDYTVPGPVEFDDEPVRKTKEEEQPTNKNMDTSASEESEVVPASDTEDLGKSDTKKPSDNKVSKKGYWTASSLRDDLQNKRMNASNLSDETLAQRQRSIWSKFVNSATIKQPKAAWQPRTPVAPLEDYTADLLCHARLYVFSHRFECGDLATLSLQKLRLTLSRFDPLEDIHVVTELTRYAYIHTQDHEGACDRLRKLVIEYIIGHLEKFTQQRTFGALLQEGGALADDLLTMTTTRIG